jgi:hypothetical protein
LCERKKFLFSFQSGAVQIAESPFQDGTTKSASEASLRKPSGRKDRRYQKGNKHSSGSVKKARSRSELSALSRELDGKSKNLVSALATGSSLRDSSVLRAICRLSHPPTPNNYHNLFIHFSSTKHNRLLSQCSERGSSERAIKILCRA